MRATQKGLSTFQPTSDPRTRHETVAPNTSHAWEVAAPAPSQHLLSTEDWKTNTSNPLSPVKFKKED